MNYCGSCYFFLRDGKCAKDGWTWVTSVSVACDKYTEIKLSYDTTSTTYTPKLSCTTTCLEGSEDETS